jgi:hypothetical protein
LVEPTVQALDGERAPVTEQTASALDAPKKEIVPYFEPIDDLLSTARHRRHAVKILVRRFIEGLVAKKSS